MFSISRVNKLCLKIEAGRILLDAPSFSAHFRNLVRPFAVILMAAALAACAQSSVVTFIGQERTYREIDLPVVGKDQVRILGILDCLALEIS